MDVEAPSCLKMPLKIPNKTLMGPGPSNASSRVLYAMGQPILGHMHPELFKIMDDIKEGIRYIFQTKNELTLCISASGHAGMEATLCNLIEDGDSVLIAINGIWGARACDMARRYGAIVHKIEAELGNNFSLARLAEAINKYKPKLLFIVQGESSTGVYQPIEGLGEICHRHNCLLAVDTVASLGGVPMLADQWGVDVIYTGSQKVLGSPAGITPISFSPRALKAILKRRIPIKVYYFDVTVLGQQWGCFDKPRCYHHTTCSNLLAGLREGLAQIAEEGLEKTMKRHKNCAEMLYIGLNKLGMQPFITDEYKRLPTVTTIKVPEDCDWKDIVGFCMQKYMLEIAGGLGPTGGIVLRIGLMGQNAKLEYVEFLLQVLKEALEHARKLRKSKL